MNVSVNKQDGRLDKVVYILGAGFSKPAGAPSQAEILGDIFRLENFDTRIKGAQDELRRFLEDDLRIRVDGVPDAVLEDIYTPIDRCIADGTSLKSKSASDLAHIRNQLQFLISTAIAKRISDGGTRTGNDYIRKFAKYIVKKASKRAELAKDTESAKAAKDYDPLSIISLNWDIILDNALHNELESDCSKRGDYDPFGVVDYCCYISSIRANDSRVRSGLWTLGCRGYNVKLLKLHGSMNWLKCPNCQRLFVEFGDKQEILNLIGEMNCRHCEQFDIKNKLSGSLVMPTFLKDLSNFQIKLVWQNAGVEILEANRLVFIGYSLPQADFEFRQLLSRMVHPQASVEVALFSDGSAGSERSFLEEKKRYEQFFGSRKISFTSSGVIPYIDGLTHI